MCVANDFKLWLAINICWIVKFQNLKAQNEFDIIYLFEILISRKTKRNFLQPTKVHSDFTQAGFNFSISEAKVEKVQMKTTFL